MRFSILHFAALPLVVDALRSQLSSEDSCFDGLDLEEGDMVRIMPSEDPSDEAEEVATNLNGAVVEGCAETEDERGRICVRTDIGGVSCWRPSQLQRTCNRLNASQLELPADVAELIFVRHGLSLNNVYREHGVSNTLSVVRHLAMMHINLGGEDMHWDLNDPSRFRSGYERVCHVEKLCGDYSEGSPSRLAWEIDRASRDCLLHPLGEELAFDLGELLARIVPADAKIQGFYASPLRRTIETLLAASGPLALHYPSASVAVQPWAHERYNTRSDWAQSGSLTARFAQRYGTRLGDRLTPALESAIANLSRQLEALGDWPNGYGSSRPQLEVRTVDASDPDAFPFYPAGKVTLAEPRAKLQERMVILRRWLKNLEPGRRHVLVAHGGIGEALFGRHAPDGRGKLENLGVALARFRPGDADAEDDKAFFSEVALARDRWDCDLIPGWKLKSETCRRAPVATGGLLLISALAALAVQESAA
mmetsp:Transcript_86537/g.269329  ORF Transcript_86537/g.269329 Transcript_86537/m.269329 type:complete len:479 (+) Transcript_86537:74-1510(+)